MKARRFMSLECLVFSNLLVLLFACMAIAQHPDSDGKRMFKLVKTAVLESSRRNTIDARIYQSKDGKNIDYTAEIFLRLPNEISAVFDKLQQDLFDCTDSEDVISVKNAVVGRRTICKSSKATNSPMSIIFTYDDILVTISGGSLEMLKTFESETCVRSKTIVGITCKY